MADDVKAAIIIYGAYWALVTIFVGSAFLINVWWQKRGEAARSELQQHKD
ncbi:MAG TPA: hypothetical protein VGN34_02830 [Ktedonobacteraceae bacterium]|jgi:hypothetical protein